MLELPQRMPAAPPGALVRMMVAPAGARMRMFRRLCAATAGSRPLFW